MGIDLENAPSLEGPLATLASKTADSAKVYQPRPNNTTAYTAGDVVGVGPTAVGGPALMTFTFAKLATALANGGELLITSTEINRLVAAVVSGETSYTLYLYSAPPPTILLDNAAFSLALLDEPYYLGALNLGSPVVQTGSAFIYNRTDGVNAQFTVKSNVIYGYLMTVGGYTPVANTILSTTLHGVAL